MIHCKPNKAREKKQKEKEKIIHINKENKETKKHIISRK
jgi:hypothetical protein